MSTEDHAFSNPLESVNKTCHGEQKFIQGLTAALWRENMDNFRKAVDSGGAGDGGDDLSPFLSPLEGALKFLQRGSFDEMQRDLDRSLKDNIYDSVTDNVLGAKQPVEDLGKEFSRLLPEPLADGLTNFVTALSSVKDANIGVNPETGKPAINIELERPVTINVPGSGPVTVGPSLSFDIGTGNGAPELSNIKGMHVQKGPLRIPITKLTSQNGHFGAVVKAPILGTEQFVPII